MPRDIMEDYTPVSERIAHFYEKWPEGRIQTEIVELGESRVTMLARAWRNPDDTLPTTGHSWLNLPGSTSFTRGSEIENAETSAVGRALAIMGFDTHKGLASAEEVAGKRQPPKPAQSAPRPPGDAPRAPQAPTGLGARDFFAAIDEAGVDRKAVSAAAKDLFGQWQVTALNGEQRATLLERLTHAPAQPEASGEASGTGTPAPSPDPEPLWDGLPVLA